VVNFVLKPPRREESDLIDESIDRALAAWPMAKADWNAATQRLNTRPPTKPRDFRSEARGLAPLGPRWSPPRGGSMRKLADTPIWLRLTGAIWLMLFAWGGMIAWETRVNRKRPSTRRRISPAASTR
jgi:hypothetical protein